MKRIILLLLSILLLSPIGMAQSKVAQKYLSQHVDNIKSQTPITLSNEITFYDISYKKNILTYTYIQNNADVANQMRQNGPSRIQKQEIFNKFSSDPIYSYLLDAHAGLQYVYLDQDKKHIVTFEFSYQALSTMQVGPLIHISLDEYYTYMNQQVALTKCQLPITADEYTTLEQVEFKNDTLFYNSRISSELDEDYFQSQDLAAIIKANLTQQILFQFSTLVNQIQETNTHFCYNYFNDDNPSLLRIIIEPHELLQDANIYAQPLEGEEIITDTLEVPEYESPLQSLYQDMLIDLDLYDEEITDSMRAVLYRSVLKYFIDTIFSPAYQEETLTHEFASNGTYMNGKEITFEFVYKNGALPTEFVQNLSEGLLEEAILAHAIDFPDLLPYIKTGECSIDLLILSHNGTHLARKHYANSDIDSLILKAEETTEEDFSLIENMKKEIALLKPSLPIQVNDLVEVVDMSINDTIYTLTFRYLSKQKKFDKDEIEYNRLTMMRNQKRSFTQNGQLIQAVEEHLNIQFIFLSHKGKELFRYTISAQELMSL